jgi:nitroreductase
MQTLYEGERFMKNTLKDCWFKKIVVLGLLAAWLTAAPASAQEKAAGQPTPGTTAEFKVPAGTMDTITAIMTRRSIRDYTSHPVPEELVKLLVEAGMCAPSAFDERSSNFIVINDRKILDAIYQLNTKALQIKKATVAIMVCGNTAKEKFPGKGYWQLDGAVAAENIFLAAHSVGLGAVWTAIYPYEDRMAAVKKLLDLPETVHPLCIIPIGYPAEKKFRQNRFDAARFHQNKW